jgi:ERCC4-type nuclease
MEIIVDTREQSPFSFPSEHDGEEIKVSIGTLPFGDYTIRGLEEIVAIERKSLPDIVACCGAERDRFNKELLALRGYKCKAVIIEATLADIIKGKWRGKVLPQMVLGSIASWRVKFNIDFIYAGNAECASMEAFRIMKKYRDFCLKTLKKINIAG